MPVQNSVSLTPSTAFAGMLLPAAPKFARSALTEGATLSAGFIAKRGTDKNKQVKLFASTDTPTTQNVAGVVLLSTSRAFEDVTPLATGKSVSVLRFGVVALSFTGAVTAGQGVAMLMSDGSTLIGVDHTAAPLSGYHRVPGMRIAETTAATGLAMVEVNLMSGAGADVTVPYRESNIPVGGVALGSLGSNLVHVAGSEYWSEIEINEDRIATGLGILNGATVGTDSLIFALADANGVILATSALVGVLSAGADAFQQIAFTAPIGIAKGKYFLVVQCNGTTAKTRRIAASTYLNAAGSQTGAFGTIAAITPASTTTADMGPIGYVY